LSWQTSKLCRNIFGQTNNFLTRACDCAIRVSVCLFCVKTFTHNHLYTYPKDSYWIWISLDSCVYMAVMHINAYVCCSTVRNYNEFLMYHRYLFRLEMHNLNVSIFQSILLKLSVGGDYNGGYNNKFKMYYVYFSSFDQLSWWWSIFPLARCICG
jgi:hypothetical protein